jgi:hypothetical protein
MMTLKNEEIKIFFQGCWSESSVFVNEVRSTRLINEELENLSIASWNDMLRASSEAGKKIWDSDVYRLESFEMSTERLSIYLATIPFSVRLGMNKHTEMVKQLGLEYSPKGMFSSCLVKTSDNYFVFIEKSDVYFTQKRFAWVGGIISKSESIIRDGKDLFTNTKREVLEELGIESKHILEIFLKTGYLTENHNVCLLFSVQVSLTKNELLDKFNKYSDDEACNLVFFSIENNEDFLKVFESKDVIKFALLKVI